MREVWQSLQNETRIDPAHEMQPMFTEMSRILLLPSAKKQDKMLHPLSFWTFMETCLVKLASDEFYSDKLRAEFPTTKWMLIMQLRAQPVGGRPMFIEMVLPKSLQVCVLSGDCFQESFSERLNSLGVWNDQSCLGLAHLTGATVKEGKLLSVFLFHFF